jgi:FKBP-type peptidyl-prolyl cis-trans isomerase FkpA
MNILTRLSALTLCLTVVTGCQQQQGAGTVTPVSELDKQAYSIGASIGDSVKRNIDQIKAVEEDFSDEMFLQGLQDALKDNPQLPQDEMNTIASQFQQEFFKKHRAQQEELAAKNIEGGKVFLAENSKKDGVKQTESGLQYKVLTEGTGPKAKASDTVKVHYKGTLIDGTEFDSSYKRGEPAQFPLTGVIKGWTEGLQLMPVGSKYEFYIPADLAYGASARPTIPANSTLIFEVELLEIVKPEIGAGFGLETGPYSGIKNKD